MPLFNVADWLHENALGFDDLTPETQYILGSFTQMWNLFESLICHRWANVRKFQMIIDGKPDDSISDEDKRIIFDAIEYWRNRYFNGNVYNNRYDGLNFRINDNEDHVRAVFEMTKTSYKDKALAVLIIIYRLRNNLFHGIKTFDMLNEQQDNLNLASWCLSVFLKNYTNTYAFQH